MIGVFAMFGFLPVGEPHSRTHAGPPGQASEGRRVRIARVRKAPLETELALSGECRAQREVDLSARRAGHVSRVLVDTEQDVKTGQELAEIALLDGQTEKVLAPFAGRITACYVCPGQAVFPLAPGDDPTRRGLFHLAQIDSLRVVVSVPHVHVDLVKPNAPAIVTVEQLPHSVDLQGTVKRIAGVVSPATRGGLVEVEVQLANANRALRPGAKVGVKLPLKASEALTVPLSALAEDSQGTRVAVIDHTDVVHFRRVQVGTKTPTVAAVLSGLSDGEMVVLHPDPELLDGTTIQHAEEPAGP
jgi:multidrug efflux pump subunit AcrA (membrane-fusion protein)